jgi:hypothetical protein
MKKRYTAAQAAAQVHEAHAAGIEVVAYLIAGFPGETESDFAASLEWLESLAPSLKLVRSVNSLLLIPGAELADEPEAHGITAPDREAHGWERLWQAGDLTADERTKRVERLEARLGELGVPVEFSNRDDLVADTRRHTERMGRIEKRLTALDRRWDEWQAKADELLAPSLGREKSYDIALALCPVWGPDMPPYGLASLAGIGPIWPIGNASRRTWKMKSAMRPTNCWSPAPRCLAFPSIRPIGVLPLRYAAALSASIRSV